MTTNTILTLDEQRREFASRRLLAMPLTGATVWLLIAISSQLFSPFINVWVLFIGTGSIAYIAMFVSRFTGENILDKSRPKNSFDTLFLLIMAASLASFAIAIPFFQVEYSSLPLSVGILTGTMWIPLSWVIQHPIGIIHAAIRIPFIVAAYYLFPEDRFLIIPLIIVAVYAMTIFVLETRWRTLEKTNEVQV
ncbi:MAG: hypothetical protein GKR91_12525 [Pseudomonadales bacterium]|nr:hypothetical protein [Pseudomonadales bacterium]